MPDGLLWPVWRLVVKRIATLAEIEHAWCLTDLVLANEALDLEEDVENERERLMWERVAGR